MRSGPPLSAFSLRAQGGTLIRLYYKTATGKKEVPFAKFGKFTIKNFEQAERERGKAREREEKVGPECPQRAKKSGRREEIDRRAPKCPGEHIEPQLTAADAQGEKKHGEHRQRAVERIERGGEEPIVPAVQPQSAQKVVNERERCAEQEGSEKSLSLRG